MVAGGRQARPLAPHVGGRIIDAGTVLDLGYPRGPAQPSGGDDPPTRDRAIDLLHRPGQRRPWHPVRCRLLGSDRERNGRRGSGGGDEGAAINLAHGASLTRSERPRLSRHDVGPDPQEQHPRGAIVARVQSLIAGRVELGFVGAALKHDDRTGLQPVAFQQPLQRLLPRPLR